VTSGANSPTPAWEPDPETVARANVTALAASVAAADYAALHRWSVDHRAAFWGAVIDRLGIVFRTPPQVVLDDAAGVEEPRWLAGAELNIVESCFTAAAEAPAVVYRANGRRHTVSYAQLQRDVGRAANGLRVAGVQSGERIAIAMPMTYDSVVAYLAVVSIGGVVVSIADSFAAEEIATRLRITGARTVVTQDAMVRTGKRLPMAAKVIAASAERCIVVDTGAGLTLRDEDLAWQAVVAADGSHDPHIAGPEAHTNILFSSGTTGDPKAIAWSQLTPIKAAMDGHFHHDIQPGDVVAWPTNLGWMMGPWLIYASLINKATIALHDDAPTGREFGEFVAEAGVTMLGVVPSLVAAWRATGCMAGLDWSAIRRFSSTGEVSNADDMRFLMALAGGKPVIEYCGGTEIGGGYITGTMVQPAVPGAFSTPALGLDVRILDESGKPADSGELFIVPPSIGLSTDLLNRDHHDVYYADVPTADVPLRRHGDQFERLDGGYLRAHGRVDDTMNLGGIKVASAELERVVARVDGVAEAAAIAVEPSGGGPSRLVIYAVAELDHVADVAAWRRSMQVAIRADLNPLFKVHDVVAVDELPRTASAKVMRRTLREQYPT